MTGGEPVYRVVKVTKVYRSGGVETVALRDVDLEVGRGEYVAIVGPSGSGKSTLLNIMGLLDRPTKGKVYLEGKDVTGLSDAEASRLRSRYIGFVFQMFNLVPWLTALENVELAASIAGQPRREARRSAEELLRMVGLGHRLHHKPSQLSGGEQQRVAIARALINKPSVLLADEPTGTLDSATGQQVVELLRSLTRQGVTVVAVTHNPDVAKVADRVVKLRDGSIVGVERP
ncbi:MAG: macrolide ABC transporter ATP-binding protein [Thermoprotei archaeon]|nr:MAG: macrolide ABC transporter ATP-binding protein [Thermoprotei archaeon]